MNIGYEIQCVECNTTEVILQGDYFNTIEIVFRCDTCEPRRSPTDRRGFKKRYKKYEHSTSKPLRF